MQKEILNLVGKSLAELDTMAEVEYPPSDREAKEMASIAGTIIHLMEAYQDNLSSPYISKSAPSIYEGKEEKH